MQTSAFGRKVGLIRFRMHVSIPRRCGVRLCCHTASKGQALSRLEPALDEALSRRPLVLDPAGYFIIYISQGYINVDHYTNTIDKDGLACDPDTGEVIPCTPGHVRSPSATFRGTSAKQLSVDILENDTGKVTRLEHANYLGRELQRAELALLLNKDYVQD